MKSEFEKKWKEFVEFEGAKFEAISGVIYLQRQDLFLLRTMGRYIQIRVSNEDFKKKMISISEIKGKHENSN